jgi:hypothetical protein
MELLMPTMMVKTMAFGMSAKVLLVLKLKLRATAGATTSELYELLSKTLGRPSLSDCANENGKIALWCNWHLIWLKSEKIVCVDLFANTARLSYSMRIEHFFNL